mgnify:CR=1 FL=1
MPGYVSIERLFDSVRNELPPDIACRTHVCPRFSKGVWPRIVNLLDARRHQSSVNHITGDSHYLALALEGRRTVLTIHDCASLERLRGFKRAVFKHFWYTLPVRRAAVVTVVSEATRRELLRHVACDERKVRVVANCVGGEFKPCPRPFNEAGPVLLQIGTAANKNLERVIEAIAGLVCRLNIIGSLSGSQRALLERFRTRFTNITQADGSQLLEAYHECDMLVFASTYEGFGLPIIEANAVGRPVVTGNILSMPEVAADAACLVDPLDVASIRVGIQRVWKDARYRDALVQAGYENVRRFEPRTVAAQYAAIYRELAFVR